MNFFSFGTKLSPRAARVGFSGWDSPDDLRLDSPNAQKLLTGAYGSTAFPIDFEHRSGKTFGDILDTRSAILFLISERLRMVLEEERLSGWKTFDVSIADRTGKPRLGYYGLTVTGRSGPIDLSESEAVQKRLVPEGPLSTYYKGFSIDSAAWDGSDFFLPRSHYGIMISERAATIFIRENISNLKLRSIADIEIDEYTANLIRGKS